jgi:hypothetical protein
VQPVIRRQPRFVIVSEGDVKNPLLGETGIFGVGSHLPGLGIIRLNRQHVLGPSFSRRQKLDNSEEQKQGRARQFYPPCKSFAYQEN